MCVRADAFSCVYACVRVCVFVCVSVCERVYLYVKWTDCPHLDYWREDGMMPSCCL